MNEKIIKLCYRKIIDAESNAAWEKFVFNDTYSEFLMQVQNHNQDKKYDLYSDVVKNVPAAEKVSFLVGTAAVGYLKQLKGIVPDIRNSLGKLVIPFKNYKFEIIESSIRSKQQHIVAIHFISEPVVWHETVANQLLVSLNGDRDTGDGSLLTELIPLQHGLSIFSLQKEKV